MADKLAAKGARMDEVEDKGRRRLMILPNIEKL
jgi:hypothetical protein